MVLFYIFSLLIAFFNISHGFKEKVAAPFGFVERTSPVYCTNDWMCKTYCSPGQMAYCPSIYKMGPEVKYGTCFCCDNHLGYFEQSCYGCSGSCSQIFVRLMIDNRAPQQCPEKNEGGLFSWFGGTAVMRQDTHHLKKDGDIESEYDKIQRESI